MPARSSRSQTHRHRPFEVVAPGFVELGEPAVGRADTITRHDASPVAPFAAVEVDVLGTEGVVVAGLTDPDGDGVLVTFDAAASRVTIEARVGGRRWVLGSRRVSLPAAFTLGFAVCENQVTALARQDGHWRPLLTERARVAAVLDLRQPATLQRLGYTWGVRSGTATLGEARAGLFGMTGLRDPHLVQHADGTPYVRDGRAYLSWTCAGLGFFAQAHWGVFALDLADPSRLEQVAQLYARRGGLLLGDHAGQLVRDGDRWLVGTSSWGDFETGGVHVRHGVSTDDLLSGVHLLETEPTTMPTTLDTWDPGFTRVEDRWVTSYVESASQRPFRFHPALAESYAAEPWTGLVRVGGADDLRQCEGPVLVERDGRRWMLASDGAAKSYPVFDLEMRPAGHLDAPYQTNIPHPQLVPRDDGGWLLVTFNGTPADRHPARASVMGYGGHGDVVVMNSPGKDR
ncbi:MAG: hypothetical protein ABI873_13720 [Marmoricola sp.]